MRTRPRWLAVAMAGFIALAAAISFAPETMPAVPPPVRLEGELGTNTAPSQSELVIVPAPSVDLGGQPPVTPTTVTPAPPSTVDESPTTIPPTQTDDRSGDSTDSGSSADSPDD